jgi:hypothetical protein
LADKFNEDNDHRKSNNGVRILWAISWVSTLDPKSLRVNDHAKTK